MNLKQVLLRLADNRCQRWIVSKRLHHIYASDGDRWPILRISLPNIIEGRFASELRAFDEKKSPWSRHQLIVPDPFVPTHVCRLLLKLRVDVDRIPRIMRSTRTEVRCTISPCWQSPVHRFYGLLGHSILCLVPTTDRRHLLSSALAIPYRPLFNPRLVARWPQSARSMGAIIQIHACGKN
jgi:hypothetical protein